MKLIQYLERRDPFRAVTATDVLGKLGEHAAREVPALIKYVEHRDSLRRSQIATAARGNDCGPMKLGRLGAPRPPSVRLAGAGRALLADALSPASKAVWQRELVLLAEDRGFGSAPPGLVLCRDVSWSDVA